MDYYIALDVGGSSVKAAALNVSDLKLMDNFEILYEKVENTFTYSKITAIINFLAKKIKDQFHPVLPSGLGISLAGLIDNRDFTIAQSPNLPSLNGKNLLRDISDNFDCPLSIMNDALSFTLGEYSRYDRRTSPFIGITLGTGIGGGVIIDQRPFIGYRGYGFEVGHMNIESPGPVCSCGRSGCLESFCGGFNLKRFYISECIENNNPVSESIEISDIAELARKNEPVAKGLFDRLGKYLGRGMGSVLNLFNPQVIVFGGKISRSFDLFEKVFFEELEIHSYSATFSDVTIDISKDSDMRHFSGCCLVFNRKELDNFILY